MKWHLTHLPSLHALDAERMVFVTKDSQDHTKIVAEIYHVKHIHQKLVFTKIEIGSNEDLYLTDCVFLVHEQLMYFALNKRTKSSEPHVVEIVGFDLANEQNNTMKPIGRAIRSNTQVRHMQVAADQFLAAFTM